MADVTRFRVATYNIHKCRGFDRKTVAGTHQRGH